MEVVTKVKGTAEAVTNELEIGDTLVGLVEFEVTEAHSEKASAKGVKIHQALTLQDFLPTEEADQMLRKMRAERRARRDAEAGVVPAAAWTEQAETYVDASGVVMTPQEIAEARGETWSPEESFTIEFANGERALWPDEFPGQDLAAPGGTMRVPTDDEVPVREQVVAYFDADGVELARWSDADEEARAELVEQRQAEREAAEAAAAVAELEAGRSEPLVGEEPLSKVKAATVVAAIKGSDDKSWMARVLHAERGSAKPRKSVLNAVMAQLGEEPDA